MHCNTHGSQITDAHHTADDISTQIVKHQYLPNRIAISIEYGRDWRKETVGEGFFRLGRLDRFVEIEDLL